MIFLQIQGVAIGFGFACCLRSVLSRLHNALSRLSFISVHNATKLSSPLQAFITNWINPKSSLTGYFSEIASVVVSFSNEYDNFHRNIYKLFVVNDLNSGRVFKIFPSQKKEITVAAATHDTCNCVRKFNFDISCGLNI